MELAKNFDRKKVLLKFCLFLMATAALCAAVANPRQPNKATEEARKGIDLVIALDVSNSMLANDVLPSRLAKARQFIYTLMERLPNDRIALVAFAGNAYLQMPLTFDHAAARMYVSAANPAAYSAQGTSIGDALQKASVAFGEEMERFGSVVLITDGETHDEDALAKAKALAQRGVMINTVGIGSAEGTTIMDTATGTFKKDENGQVVISKLNEAILRQIASLTNGTYVHLENNEAAVKQVMDQYTNIEKKALGDSSLFTYRLYYAWLAAPALLLLLVDLFITDKKRKQ